MKDLQKENKMSRKVTKISLTPEFFGQVDKDGDETLWRSCKASLLHYEDGTIKKGELYEMKYYRLVSAEQANDVGVREVDMFTQEDFKFNRMYFKYIEPEGDAIERFFATQKAQENKTNS